ncbi:hypothetical protein HanXRQr2_Chr12g0525621 [Helianthus annuus]|uniref:Uncharacterized protein n=1 Tax=Helianthus annuus TaxID=4232 RepID=A0A9K3HEF6_HELAN|nr:hypothetical protein HanXRQr2_Chr12g0525621 [Helianthus annuus]KAJ0488241.1 hypothetical protein HanHA300_Chr12g0430771 [Helianthus annuus]KAJ0504075.1 hypothetical protein HanHA89_Chr12g0455291 [Helianthus annuus]KAJ0861418.1 hypothetical protein HanPSC8_Chr12g0506411 [Helianthus annuus]
MHYLFIVLIGLVTCALGVVFFSGYISGGLLGFLLFALLGSFHPLSRSLSLPPLHWRRTPAMAGITPIVGIRHVYRNYITLRIFCLEFTVGILC